MKELSQKMEELSSQEKPEEDEIISGDKNFFHEQFKPASQIEVLIENGDASPEGTLQWFVFKTKDFFFRTSWKEAHQKASDRGRRGNEPNKEGSPDDSAFSGWSR